MQVEIDPLRIDGTADEGDDAVAVDAAEGGNFACGGRGWRRGRLGGGSRRGCQCHGIGPLLILAGTLAAERDVVLRDGFGELLHQPR